MTAGRRRISFSGVPGFSSFEENGASESDSGGHKFPFWSLALFIVAYVAAAGVGQGLKIIPGITITFWPPAGIFVALLLLNPPRAWPGYVLAGGVAELIANALWFHNSLPWGVIYYSANALEALTAAWLLRRFAASPFRWESPEEIGAFILLGVGIAPMVGATVIATLDFYLGKHPFTTAWFLVWLGDGTGLLVSTPLTFVLVQTWRERAAIPRRHIVEGVMLLLVLFGFTQACLRGYFLTVYMTMPVLLWLAVRFQLKGAACGLALITLTVAFYTGTGSGEFVDPLRQQERLVMLQTFLGVAAISALVVGGLSHQYQQALTSLQAINSQLDARVKERTATLQASEERLRLFIENAPAAIAQFDRQMRYLAVSHRWLRDYGLPANAVGRSHYELLPEIPEEWREVHRRTLAGESLHSEGDRFVRQDGSIQWVKWETLPWYDERGEIGGILIAAEEITSFRRAEEALRDADRRKDEFLAMLAHELRNPLAPIKNCLELLKLAGNDAALREEMRETMERQLAHMIRLVDDLLDVSRITRGKLELRLEKVNLASVVKHAVETCQPLCVQAGHHLSVQLPDQPIVLRADFARLAQVFGNMLTNACKYMEPGGNVWISAERQQNEVMVQVKDAGLGIPSEMLPHVFDLFTQVDHSLDRSQGGLGIGLSLVKRLVEMHGGTVSAESAGPGQGSLFTVRLPLPEEVAAAPSVPASLPGPQGGGAKRILIVDDNRDNADSLAHLLQSLGKQVETAYDGQEAVRLAESSQPDAILLDLGLPKMNGYGVCQEIRRNGWGKKILIIALTGWGQSDDREKTSAAGFNHHLVKPLRLEMLLPLLDPAQAPHRG